MERIQSLLQTVCKLKAIFRLTFKYYVVYYHNIYVLRYLEENVSIKSYLCIY